MNVVGMCGFEGFSEMKKSDDFSIFRILEASQGKVSTLERIELERRPHQATDTFHENNINNATTEANEIVFEYAKKLAEELNAKYGFSEDSNLKANNCYNSVSYKCDYNSEFCEEYFKAREERRKKINEKIEEILLTLELGGTKADLDEMLKNVGK